jgi:hypothetical protein
MKPIQLAALLGFLFAVVWAALDFGDAILCLVCAAVFYLAYGLCSGEFSLSDIQQRISQPRR